MPIRLTQEELNAAFERNRGSDQGSEYYRRLNPENDSNIGMDMVRGVARGAINTADALVGLGDMAYNAVTGDSFRDDIQGWNDAVQGANRWLNEHDSFATVDARNEFDRAEGAVDSLGAIISNPRLLATMGAEQIPMMAGMVGAAGKAAKMAQAAGVAKGLTGKALNTYVQRRAVGASAISEGSLSGGSVASAVGQDYVDRGEDPGSNIAMAGFGAGVGTAVIGAAMGPLGGATEAMLGRRIAGAAAEGARPSLRRSIAKGFVGEGVEEGLQSAQEQAWQNVGQGLPWDTDMGKTVAQGALLGGVMGGVMGPMGRPRSPSPSEAVGSQSLIPGSNATAEEQRAVKLADEENAADARAQAMAQAQQDMYAQGQAIATNPGFEAGRSVIGTYDQGQAIGGGDMSQLGTYNMPPQQAGMPSFTQQPGAEAVPTQPQAQQQAPEQPAQPSVTVGDLLARAGRNGSVSSTDLAKTEETFAKLTPTQKKLVYLGMLAEAHTGRFGNAKATVNKYINLAKDMRGDTDQAVVDFLNSRSDPKDPVLAEMKSRVKNASTLGLDEVLQILEDDIVTTDERTKPSTRYPFRSPSQQAAPAQAITTAPPQADVAPQAQPVQAQAISTDTAPATPQPAQEVTPAEDIDFQPDSVALDRYQKTSKTGNNTHGETKLFDGDRQSIPSVNALAERAATEGLSETEITSFAVENDPRTVRVFGDQVQKKAKRAGTASNPNVRKTLEGIKRTIDNPPQPKPLKREQAEAIREGANDASQKPSVDTTFNKASAQAAPKTSATKAEPFEEFGSTALTKARQGKYTARSFARTKATPIEQPPSTVKEATESGWIAKYSPADDGRTRTNAYKMLAQAYATQEGLRSGKLKVFVPVNAASSSSVMRIRPAGYSQSGWVMLPDAKTNEDHMKFFLRVFHASQASEITRAESAAKAPKAKPRTATEETAVNEAVSEDEAQTIEQDTQLAPEEAPNEGDEQAVTAEATDLFDSQATVEDEEVSASEKVVQEAKSGMGSGMSVTSDVGRTVTLASPTQNKSLDALSTQLNNPETDSKDLGRELVRAKAKEFREKVAAINAKHMKRDKNLVSLTDEKHPGSAFFRSKEFGKETRDSFVYAVLPQSAYQVTKNPNDTKHGLVYKKNSQEVASIGSPRENEIFQAWKDFANELGRMVEMSGRGDADRYNIRAEIMDEARKLFILKEGRSDSKMDENEQMIEAEANMLADAMENAFARQLQQPAMHMRRLPASWRDVYTNRNGNVSKTRSGLINDDSTKLGKSARKSFRDVMSAEFKKAFPGKAADEVPIADRVSFFGRTISNLGLYYVEPKAGETGGHYEFSTSSPLGGRFQDGYSYADLWSAQWVVGSGLFTQAEVAASRNMLDSTTKKLKTGTKTAGSKTLAKRILDTETKLDSMRSKGGQSTVLQDQANFAYATANTPTSQAKHEQRLKEITQNVLSELDSLQTLKQADKERVRELVPGLLEDAAEKKLEHEVAVSKLDPVQRAWYEELERYAMADDHEGADALVELHPEAQAAYDGAYQALLNAIDADQALFDVVASGQKAKTTKRVNELVKRGLKSHLVAYQDEWHKFYYDKVLRAQSEGAAALEAQQEQEHLSEAEERIQEEKDAATELTLIYLGSTTNSRIDLDAKHGEKGVMLADKVADQIIRDMTVMEVSNTNSDKATTSAIRSLHRFVDELNAIAKDKKQKDLFERELAKRFYEDPYAKLIYNRTVDETVDMGFVITDKAVGDKAVHARTMSRAEGYDVYVFTKRLLDNIQKHPLNTSELATAETHLRGFNPDVHIIEPSKRGGFLVEKPLKGKQKQTEPEITLTNEAENVSLKEAVSAALTSLRHALYVQKMRLYAGVSEGATAEESAKLEKLNTKYLQPSMAKSMSYDQVMTSKTMSYEKDALFQVASHLVAAGMPINQALELMRKVRYTRALPDDNLNNSLIMQREDGIVIVLPRKEKFSKVTENGKSVFKAEPRYTGLAMQNIAHELMHYQLGTFSGTPESAHADFVVEIQDNHVIPIGDAAKEIFSLMEQYPGFSELMKYPIGAVGKLGILTNPEQVQEELLVQMASIWVHDPRLQILIAHDAPVLAQHLADRIGQGAYTNEYRRTSQTNGSSSGRAVGSNNGGQQNNAGAESSVSSTDGDDPDDGGSGPGSGRSAVQELGPEGTQESAGSSSQGPQDRGTNQTAQNSGSANPEQKINAQNTVLHSVSESAFAAPSQVEKAINRLPKARQKQARLVADTARGWWLDKIVNVFSGLQFTNDLARRAAKYLPSIKQVVTIRQEREAWQNMKQTELAKFNYRKNALSKPLRDKVNKLLEDTTLTGVWAERQAWMSNEDWNNNISTKDKHEAQRMLKARLDALPESAKSLYRDVLSYGYESQLEMRKVGEERIGAAYDEAISQAYASDNIQEAEELSAERENLLSRMGYNQPILSRPYVPLLREGSHVVVARSKALEDAQNQVLALRKKKRSKDGLNEDEQAELSKLNATVRQLKASADNYMVVFTDGQAEANRLATKLADQFDGVVEAFPRAEISKRESISFDMIATLEKNISNRMQDSLDEDNADAKRLVRKMTNLLTELYIRQLADNSARKNQLHREGVAGYNTDMIANTVEKGSRDAYMLGQAKYAKPLSDAMQTLALEAQQSGGEIPRATRMQMYNEIIKREQLDFDYKPNTLADRAQRLTSVWMLLTSPAFYLQNMTQPFMMSAPYIAGRFGAKAFSGMAENMKLVAKAFVDKANFKDGVFELDKVKGLPQDLIDAAKECQARGHIDIGISQDFGQLSPGAFQKATDFMSRGARGLEIVNRLATFKTAYEFEKARQLGMGKSLDAARDAALEYADTVVVETHGDYSSQNEPRFFKRNGMGLGGAEKLVFQFRKFQLIQLGMMVRLAKDAYAGATNEEKAVARKALSYVMGTHFAMTGALGMPFVSTLAWALSLAFGDEGDDEEDMLRKAIGNKELSDLLLKGGPAAMGLDVSERIGAGNMLSVFPYLNASPLDGRTGALETMAAFGGPAVSQILRSANGLALMQEGDYYKGVEAMLPNGLANAMKAVRFGSEGYTTRNGTVTIPADEYSAMDMFWQALGLPTTVSTDRIRLQGKLIRVEEARQKEETRLNKAYRNAKTGAERRAVMREYVELQKKYAAMGLKPKSVTQLQKNLERVEKDARNAVGGVISNNTNRTALQSWAGL